MDELHIVQAAETYAKLRQYFKHKAWVFVTGLEGRYQKWISDEMLISLLAQGTLAAHIIMGQERIVEAAYNVARNIFETSLECDCAAGGNGHHVAQDYAKLFGEFDNEPKPAA